MSTKKLNYSTFFKLTLFTGNLLASAAPLTGMNEFKMVILHNNDMHGRFEETERNSGPCQASHRNISCIGGFARTAYIIRKFRKEAQEGNLPPVLFLNAGDTFVGTSWFSVFTWNISAALINLLQPDAMCLGNHEFDLKASVLAPFVNGVNTPVLAANLDFYQEPSFESIKKSVILEVSGWKIGIVGYLTPETTIISNVGNVSFENEISAIRKETKKLKQQDVKIIIALGHSGFDMDQKIAMEVNDVDIVVGGHTNTFLWNGQQPDLESVEGPYPKIVTQKSGKRVPVVQAYAYTKYLGILNVTFNNSGDLTHFSGQPLLLETDIPQAVDIIQQLEIYRPDIDKLTNQIVGTSKVVLDSASCRKAECNFGNLICDALVAYATFESVDHWTSTPIGLYNGGGIRSSLIPGRKAGEITRGDLLGAIPFGNQVTVLTLKGIDLYMMLEQMVRSNGETSRGEFPQVAGLKIVFDMSRHPYSRVVSVKARCGMCDIPHYQEVNLKNNYTLVTSSFLSEGGDGITVLRDKAMDKRNKDLIDLDVLSWYFNKYSPVYPEIQERITFVENINKTAINTSNSNIGIFRLILILILILIGIGN